MRDELFGIGIRLVSGEELDTVVRSVVNLLERISDQLAPLGGGLITLPSQAQHRLAR